MQNSLNYLIGHPSYAIPFWKRCIDVLAASILILLLSPLFLIIAILIKLESPGPIIYRAKGSTSPSKGYSDLRIRYPAFYDHLRLPQLFHVQLPATGQ